MFMHDTGVVTKVRTLPRLATIERARALRRGDTAAEARLWHAIRARRLGGWRWKRQVPWGPYFLDFLCAEAALVVEVDGGQHSERMAYDARRTAYLERHGLRVLRFWNHDVMTNRDGVCQTILDACGGEHAPTLSVARAGEAAPSPLPPRSGEGEGRERAAQDSRLRNR